MQENKQVSKMFWGRHLWGRGYFVATSGNITDEVIMEYIKKQDENEDSGDFTIAGQSASADNINPSPYRRGQFSDKSERFNPDSALEKTKPRSGD